MSKEFSFEQVLMWIRITTKEATDVDVRHPNEAEVVVAVNKDLGEGAHEVQVLEAHTAFPDTTWRKPGRVVTQQYQGFIESRLPMPNEPTAYAIRHAVRNGEGDTLREWRSYLVIIPPNAKLVQASEKSTVEEEPKPKSNAYTQLRDMGLTAQVAGMILGAAGEEWAVPSIDLADTVLKHSHTEGNYTKAIRLLRGMRSRPGKLSTKIQRLRSVRCKAPIASERDFWMITSGAIKLLELKFESQQTQNHG